MPRIVRFHELGSADVLKLEEVDAPRPGSKEVRLKVEAIGLNRAECVFREGKYLEQPTLPSRIGYEAAGVVEAVGEGVSGLSVGDKVSVIPCGPMSKYGVYGEVAVVPEWAAARYPSRLTAIEAASIWMQYLTAYGALVEFGKMAAGDFVVITAASSSVGYAAIQLANAFGAIPIATTRGESKVQLLTDAGAKHVIVTEKEDLAKRVKEITNGKGARLTFDPIAGPFIKQLAEAAADEGTIFEYGALSGQNPPFPLMIALKKGLTITGYTLFQITANQDRLKRAQDYIYNALNEGLFSPVVEQQMFKLDQIVEAQRFMESNVQNGKIVVTV